MSWLDSLRQMFGPRAKKTFANAKNTWLVDFSEKIHAWRYEFDELSQPEKVFRAVWKVEAEVNNGGFNQFYANSSGDTARFTDEALEAIGAPIMADIVRRSRAVFQNGDVPTNWEQRQEVVLEFSAEQEALLTDLDGEFYAYPEDLTELLYAYVQANLPAIRGASEMKPLG